MGKGLRPGLTAAPRPRPVRINTIGLTDRLLTRVSLTTEAAPRAEHHLSQRFWRPMVPVCYCAHRNCADDRPDDRPVPHRLWPPTQHPRPRPPGAVRRCCRPSRQRRSERSYSHAGPEPTAPPEDSRRPLPITATALRNCPLAAHRPADWVGGDECPIQAELAAAAAP